MKYRINKNQPPLTDADLSSARDFDTLLRNYHTIQIPFYRTARFFGAGSAILVTAVVAVIMLTHHRDVPLRAFIAPPLTQVDIPLDTYTVDADSATEIDYPSGSRLHIPAQAFRDAGGTLIRGKVTINYREFHDQKDIFISGIPMTYDSAGQSYVFRSAGMMEITASQNGKALAANQANPIKVDMVSSTSEDKYNTYYLDTAAKKWIDLHQANLDQRVNGPEEPTRPDSTGDLAAADPAIAQGRQEVQQAAAAVKALEKEKPMPITRADKSKTKFHIVVDAQEFPEIAMYSGVRFQVKDELTFDKASAKTEWEDVKLKKLKGMDYEVDFSKGDKKMQVIATPVVDDKDLPGAQKIYDSKFAQYQARLIARQAAQLRAEKELAEKAAKFKERQEAALKDQRKSEQEYRKTTAFQNIEIQELEQQERINATGRVSSDADAHIRQTDLIFRTFVVARFGVYNADYPYSWPSDRAVTASLVSETGDNLNVSNIYLVTKGYNMVYPYHVSNGECDNFRFDSSKDNQLWAVTADDKLAVIDTKSFKAQQTTSARVQLKFKLIDKQFKSSEEVRKMLEI